MPMHYNLSRRAAELAHLNDLIRTSLSLADAVIPLINEQLNGLAEMGINNLELEGPRIYSRTAGWSPAFDDEQIIYAAALTMPGGLGCATWSADEYATRYGDSHHEPPALRDSPMVINFASVAATGGLGAAGFSLSLGRSGFFFG